MSLGGSTAAAKPPPFKKVDIGSTVQLAENYANLGYATSNADFLSRFPGLVAIRNAEINDAASQITSPLDPTVENSFATNAASQTLGAFGGGAGGIGPAGSASRNAIGASITNQVEDKQNYDWNTLQNLLSANPEQSYGLSGGDVLNLLIGNTIGANQSNFAGYQSAVQSANASSAAGTQEAFAGASLAVTLLGVIL